MEAKLNTGRSSVTVLNKKKSIRLVRLTLEHPQYPLDYSFPSHEEALNKSLDLKITNKAVMTICSSSALEKSYDLRFELYDLRFESYDSIRFDSIRWVTESPQFDSICNAVQYHFDSKFKSRFDNYAIKDNVFMMSNKKSKYPVLQLELRLISDFVVVIVSAAIGGIIFSCLGQPICICNWLLRSFAVLVLIVIDGCLLAGSLVGPGGLKFISEMEQVFFRIYYYICIYILPYASNCMLSCDKFVLVW
ncbi:hypothetical protein HYC85_025530 [Camellia sinensis]|uniref:Uncharacterized protein n=1 Tax=Camellia sinensis TaxID=4442 RepID=A0A7J7GF40_CAMSI|nr:hypothetical protein HYC85_025530 [Camellia sinensis]